MIFSPFFQPNQSKLHFRRNNFHQLRALRWNSIFLFSKILRKTLRILRVILSKIPIVSLTHLSTLKSRRIPRDKAMKISDDTINLKSHNNGQLFLLSSSPWSEAYHHQLSHQSSRLYHVRWIIKSQFKVFLCQLRRCCTKSVRGLLKVFAVFMNEVENNQITPSAISARFKFSHSNANLDFHSSKLSCHWITKS